MRADNAPGLGFRIEHIWAFLSQGDGDDDEGVCAVEVGGVFMPLIAADPTRLAFLRGYAKTIASETKRTVKLVRFDQRVDVEGFRKR